jgi:ABC-2 type transport system ATP-binding protein
MLEVRDLRRSFGSVTAVDGVSFDIPRGEVVGFLGPNGAGKSTTMRSMMGVIEPDGGQVLLDGRPVSRDDRAGFGYMPEERGLYPRMRVADQLIYLARLHGLDRGWADASVRHWLDRLGLADRAESRLSELSHGNQQRVQLAAALVHEPQVLVLDEPFSGLDPVAVDALAAILTEHAASGVAVLFSSHQLDLVENLCRSVVLLDHGRVVLRGDVRALRRSSSHRSVHVAVEGTDGAWADHVADFEVLEKDGDKVRLRVEAGVDPSRLLAAARRAGSVAEFCVEPPSLSDLFREAVLA